MQSNQNQPEGKGLVRMRSIDMFDSVKVAEALSTLGNQPIISPPQSTTTQTPMIASPPQAHATDGQNTNRQTGRWIRLNAAEIDGCLFLGTVLMFVFGGMAWAAGVD